MDNSDYSDSEPDEAMSDVPRPFSNENYEAIQNILPDADPNFIRKKCEKYYQRTPLLHRFIARKLKKKRYPKKKDAERGLALAADRKLYTTHFDVKKYLEIIPEPESFFKNANKPLLNDVYDLEYALIFLKNFYCYVYAKTVHSVFVKERSIIKSANILDACPKDLKGRRCPRLLPKKYDNIEVLQEIAYIAHRKEIDDYTTRQKQQNLEKRENAKKMGSLFQCKCCFDDEVLMPEECVACEMGHLFCKSCVKKYCEVTFGEGKLDFFCLEDCGAQFNFQSLQMALPSILFTRITQKKQAQEIRTAGMEDVEFCPFCDFACIPGAADKIFQCLNTECMKETCRECGKGSHIPLRCNEVESDEQVKRRTAIEDKLTEALVSVCYKCQMKFVKEEGCNKMVCPCGAIMCYVCNQPVKDYKHFNGDGGDKYHLCPLYSNTNKEHAWRVLREAIKLSQEPNNNTQGDKFVDPLADVQKHYLDLINTRRSKT